MMKAKKTMLMVTFGLILAGLTSWTFAWWIKIEVWTDNNGQNLVDLRVGEGDRTTNVVQVGCDWCHLSDAKMKAALTKPYDSQSQMNHEKGYFLQRALNLNSLTKVSLDKDIYLAREGGRLIVVNRRENYKLVFAEDAIVLLDFDKRPAFIYGRRAYTKTRIGPLR